MLPLEIIDLIFQYIISCKNCKKFDTTTLKLGNGHYYCHKCIKDMFTLVKL